MADKPDLDLLCINTIRTLSMDAVQAANSGHPGTPMALAPVAYCLWQRFLRFDPDDPIWPNRDRFVLSNGHASMLLYSMLHLSGVKAVDRKYERLGELSVKLEDIKRFRQLDSKCPGHPEYRWTSGVETTTGPLGQGVANSVGMAMAGKWQAKHFNQPDFELFNYNVYAICGDGDMMEGVSHESASLAGHLELDNLCWIYDNNHITIEGNTGLAFSEDVATRFLAYGWNVTRVGDANDLERLEHAIQVFQRTTGQPTLIIVDSHIAYGAPNKQDTSAAHGEPLGEEEIRLTKRRYGWPEDAKFLVPDGVYQHFQQQHRQARQGAAQRLVRQARRLQEEVSPRRPTTSTRCRCRDLPAGWDKELPKFPADAKGMATRESSGKVLNAIAPKIPWLIGGAADLAPSTKTRMTFAGAGDFEEESYAGRNLHFGIREIAMGSILNGLSLSKLRPYGATFLTFSDYGRPPIRLSALMELPVIYIYTHDSIGLGEDGPTHQPVEHLASLRAIPGLITIRPGDANEVSEAWRVMVAMDHQPFALVSEPASVADLRPEQVRFRRRAGEGGVHPRRCSRRQARRDPDGHRQRSDPLRQCLRAAQGGRRQGPRGQHAVVGTIRAAERGIPGPGVAANRHGPRVGGAGIDVRLGAIRRFDRPLHRHAHFRHLGAVEGRGEEVRLHAGKGGCRGEGAGGEGEGASR